MGGELSRAKRKAGCILVTGLRHAGKTTLLDQLRSGSTEALGDKDSGLDLHSLALSDKVFTWNVGGRSMGRPRMRYFLDDVQGIAFMVDSTDKASIAWSASELAIFASERMLHDVPIVVLASRSDLPDATPLDEVRDIMELDKIKQPCATFAVSAMTLEGVPEAFKWLARRIARKPERFAEVGKTQMVGTAAVSSQKWRHLVTGFVPKPLKDFILA